MSTLRERWDARYRNAVVGSALPCQTLTENAQLLPRAGTALDLACGLGANALFLARRGLTVRAWDIAPTAIAALGAVARDECLPLRAEEIGVETVQWEPEQFDVIVVARFLMRSLAPALCESLRPRGLLFYQTFTVARPHGIGPSNPAYLLEDNELLALFSPLRLRYYREDAGCGDATNGAQGEACFIGQKMSAIGANHEPYDR